MRSVILALVGILSGVSATPDGANAEILRAIRVVECGDVPNPPKGDGGNARGPYQIWHAYWYDAVEFSGLGGTYADCDDVGYATKVVEAYMMRYCKEAWLAGDAERIARVHNGGPRGHKKKATDRYWSKVKRELDSAKD